MRPSPGVASVGGVPPTPLSLRALNRSTLRRQGLLEPCTGSVADVLGRLAGLQAQHADPPHIALWSRRKGHRLPDLDDALTDRSVVKATLVRSTLHIVAADDYPVLDTASSVSRLASWGPSARRAGVDLLALNAQVRAYCAEPHTGPEIADHLDRQHVGVDADGSIPDGVRNAWFQLGTAGGGLVHVPPSGHWHEHGRPRLVDARARLGEFASPDSGNALVGTVERYLTAYGPASLEDVMKWSGQSRKGAMRAALDTMADRLVHHRGEDGRDLFDLAGLEPSDDGPVAPRFLARWDSALIGYAVRDRLLPPEHKPAVIKKNGDVLPTFLVDGFVSGLWSARTTRGRAVLALQPFAAVPRADRAALEETAEALVRFVEPGASAHEVTWSTP